VLQEGSVGLTTEAQRRFGKGDGVVQTLSVRPAERGFQPPVQVIDMGAYVSGLDRHKLGCVVSSKTAAIFKFNRDRVLEYCNVETMATLVRNALSNAILRMSPLFTLSFTPLEIERIADTLDYSMQAAGGVFVTQGNHVDNITFVQHGKLLVQEKGKKDKMVYVGEAPKELRSGDIVCPVYIIGVKNLMYDIPSPISIFAAKEDGDDRLVEAGAWM